MNIFRRMLLWLSRLLLQTELVVWLTITSLLMVIGSAGPIKHALHSANVYGRIVDVVLKQAATASGQGDVPLNDDAIKNVVKSVFSSQQLEAYTDNFLDGSYAWLDGTSPQPNFRIDLSSARQTIAEGVANRAAERMAGLPPCTQVPTGSLDPFSITCLPPGIDIQREKQRITNEMLASADFLPNTVLTAAQLPKDQNGKTFVDNHHNLPKLFGLARLVPWALALASTLTAAAIIWLNEDKRRGIRSVGRTVLGNGSFVLVTTVVFGLLLPTLSSDLQARFVGGDAAPIMNDVLRSSIALLNRALIITSGSLVAIGGGILLAERFIKPKKLEIEKADAPEAGAKPTDAASEPETTEEPKE